MLNVTILVLLLVGSGFADGRGFLHAARIWADGGPRGAEALNSALGFASGIGLYWAALYWARKVGVVSPIVQTLLWFGTAVIGVAVASGEFGSWPAADKVLAIALAVGLGILVARHA